MTQARTLADTIGGTISQNLVFASGNGLDFSATSDGSGTATSELFDDYEEGTWTPVVRGATSAGTATYSTAAGRYTKVGDLVSITGYINFSSHTGSGFAEIIGLPYTTSQSGAVYNALAAVSVMHSTWTLSAGFTQLSMYYPAHSGITHIQLYQSGSAQTWAQVGMVAAAQLIFSLTYSIS
tara:strand:- start:3685 stop:4227 length:543 start_codon:yes stop_codon:yes gene_type:complete